MANAEIDEIDEITGLCKADYSVEKLLTDSIKHCQQMLELYKQYQSGLICSYELMDGIVLRKQSTVRSIEEAQRALMK